VYSESLFASLHQSPAATMLLMSFLFFELLRHYFPYSFCSSLLTSKSSSKSQPCCHVFIV